MKKFLPAASIVLLMLALFFLAGCTEDSPVEQAVEKVDRTVEKSGAKLAQIDEKIEQAAESDALQVTGEAAIVEMHTVDASGIGESIGIVTLTDTAHGLVLAPALRGLPPGLHGFHVHENPSCEPAERDGQPVAALSAGSHYDPAGSGQHDTPWGTGHLGDLPHLAVAADGKADTPVLAPRLSVEQVAGRALVIHAGGDNYSDEPQPLGGGGSRIACGVIE